MKLYSIAAVSGILTLTGCALFEPGVQNAESKDKAPGNAAAAESAKEMLQERRKDLSLAEQKKAVLVEQNLNTARDMIAAGRYREAERYANEALVLDPQNADAKKILGDSAALLGKRSEQEGDAYRAELEHRWDVQVQSLRAEALESLQRARDAYKAQRFDETLQECAIVLNHVKWSPMKGEWTNVESEARALAAMAEEARKTQTDTNRRQKEQDTFAKLKEQEAKEAQRKKDLLASMVANAIDAYDAKDFEECVSICDRALELEPRSNEARELRDAAFKSARDKSKTDYVAKKREEFKLWREEINETRIPYTDLVTMPDREYWEQITKKRAKRGNTTFSATETEEVRRLKELVRTTTIPSLMVKDEAEIDNVMGILRTYTGLPIIVDPAASEAVRSGSVIFNLPIENPITVKDALDIVVEVAGGQIAYVFKHDAILITTAEKAKGKSTVRNHDIQDLVFTLTDFIAPNLATLAEATSGAAKGASTPPFGGVGPEPKKIVGQDELVTMLKDTIAQGTWEQDGHRIEAFNGNLIVVHSDEVHKQVEDFLNDMRRFSSAIVSIDAKFLTVSDNFLQEIGVEFRGLGGNGLGTLANLDDVTNGLDDKSSNGFDNGGAGGALSGSGTEAAGNPSAGATNFKGKFDLRARTEGIFDSGLGNVLSSNGGATFQLSILDDTQLNMLLRMVEKSVNVKVVNQNSISAHNGQRAYVTVINQTSYISDYDVEVATAAFIADPKISIIPDGIALDVRPIIHQDRKHITLELMPTVATLVRPIQEFQTSLAGISNPVTIQLPELQVSSAFTTAVIPDGGSVLIGGLKKIRNIERKSEVPFFANIPILGALFRTTGYDEENQMLVVLIRAQITDVKEEAKKLSASR